MDRNRTVGKLAGLAFALTFAALGSIAGAQDWEFADGAVLDVRSGNIIKVETAAGRRLVALYGVAAPLTPASANRTLMKRIEELTAGLEVRIADANVMDGVTYVAIELPDGRLLNELLVYEKAAVWDRMSAPDDERLRAASIAEAPPEPEPLPEVEMVEGLPNRGETLSYAEYELLQRAKATAEFEAHLEAWERLTPTQRLSLMARFSDEMASRLGKYQSRVRTQGSQVAASRVRAAEAGAALQESQRELQQHQREAADELASVYNDYAYRAYQNLGDYYDDRQAERSGIFGRTDYTGQFYRERRNAYRSLERSRKRQLDEEAERVDDRNKAIEREKAAETARQAHKLSEAQRRARAAAGLQDATAQVARRQQNRMERHIGRMMALENAVREDYRPMVRKKLLLELEGTDTVLSPEFIVATDLGRVDCEVRFGEEPAAVSIDILEQPDNAVVTRLNNRELPYENTAILNEPGVYSLRISPKRPAPWRVRVYELTPEFPAPSPGQLGDPADFRSQ